MLIFCGNTDFFENFKCENRIGLNRFAVVLCEVHL